MISLFQTIMGYLGQSQTIDNNTYTTSSQEDNCEYIKESYIEFHDRVKYPIEDIIDIGTSAHYGIATIKMQNISILTVPIHILITIDIRTDNATRIIEKISNLVDTIREINKETYISLQYLKDSSKSLTVITERMLVTQNTKDIINEILAYIDFTQPNAIGLLLQKATFMLNTYKTEYNTHEIAHIVITNTDYSSTSLDQYSNLTTYMNTNYITYFIDCYENHNTVMLQGLNTSHSTEYFIIENINRIENVFLYIIDKIFYSVFQHIKLEIFNGKMYDWVTNTWVSSIDETAFIKNSEQVYHIKSETPEDVYLIMKGRPVNSDSIRTLDILYTLPPLLQRDTNEMLTNNLYSFIFLYKLQDYLYKGVSYISTKKHNIEYMNIEYMNSIVLLFNMIRDYMRKKQLLNDPLLIHLCDSIYLLYTILKYEPLSYKICMLQRSIGNQFMKYHILGILDDSTDSEHDALVIEKPHLKRETAKTFLNNRGKLTEIDIIHKEIAINDIFIPITNNDSIHIDEISNYILSK